MPPRDTVGRSDKGPTRSKRTSAQIKKRGTAKAAASRLKSRIKERRKKKAREAAARQRAALSRSAGEVGRGVAANKSATQVAAERKAAATKQRNVLSSRAGERGRGVPASRTVSGGRGFTVERPGARAARPAQAARMMAVNNPLSAPRTPPEMSPRNIAAQQAAQRSRAAASAAARNRAANEEAARSLLGAGYRNVAGNRNRSTLGQQFMSGIRNLMRGETLGPDTSGMTAKEKFDANPARQAFIRSRERRKKRRDRAADNVVPPKPTPEIDDFRPEIPPELIDEFPPVMPPPQYPGMGGGLGGFGYSPALMAYESQQGAGQVPYYMAAARNAMTPNMSPAFMHAARNYDILGGMQRTRARPIEMMSARERAEIMNMGSNFNVPNYNSPYNQFDYFKNMVSGGGSGGKGGGRPMPQMAGGLGAFMGGMGGMF